jgi:hypothetical protein
VGEGQLVALLISVITSIVGGLVGIAKLYDKSKDLRLLDRDEQLKSCRAENETLRLEARQTAKAIEEEKEEWKSLALGKGKDGGP